MNKWVRANQYFNVVHILNVFFWIMHTRFDYIHPLYFLLYPHYHIFSHLYVLHLSNPWEHLVLYIYVCAYDHLLEYA